MTHTTPPGGTLRLADDLEITRIGYGAMKLTGPHAFGPPKDRAAAVALLREVVDLGLTHIDTADFYGPGAVNELIREALAPYPAELTIATKVGARRTPDGGIHPSLDPLDLKSQVLDNLRSLGVEALDLVNLRLAIDGTGTEPVAEQFGALVELREQGLIRHLGLSGASASQLTEAQKMAPVVTVQNLYNLTDRHDDALVDRTAADGIAYTPFFPLGGFTPLQSETLHAVAKRLGASPQQVALAWLLRRSPTIALIPGTTSVEHLRENVAAAGLSLPPDAAAELDALA